MPKQTATGGCRLPFRRSTFYDSVALGCAFWGNTAAGIRHQPFLQEILLHQATGQDFRTFARKMRRLTPPRRRSKAAKCGVSHPYVGGAFEDEQPIDLRQPSQFHFPRPPDLLQPPQGFLYQPAFAQADPVSRMPGRSFLNWRCVQFGSWWTKCWKRCQRSPLRYIRWRDGGIHASRSPHSGPSPALASVPHNPAR